MTGDTRAGHRAPRCNRAAAAPDVIVGGDSVSSVKVWQPWIRALHWTLASTVVILSVTGFYVGNRWWTPVPVGPDVRHAHHPPGRGVVFMRC